MPFPALLTLASALPFGPPIDSPTLAAITGNGTGRAPLAVDVAIPGTAMMARADRTTGEAAAGLATGSDRSTIAILLRVDRITMGGRQIAGPLTIALHRDSAPLRNDPR